MKRAIQSPPNIIPAGQRDSYFFVTDVMIRLELSPDCISTVTKKYSEPHRYYHNLDHIADILAQIEQVKDSLGAIEYRELRLAAIFHDVVYDPTKYDNEEASVDFMRNCLHDPDTLSTLDNVGKLIMATKDHNPVSRLETLLCQMDLNGFERGIGTILSNEEKIRKEFQWLDWNTYQNKRISRVLSKFVDHPLLTESAHDDILFEMQYLAWLTPKIAVYPGTFDPFHVGHKNILLKAEKIFDKVIVAVGNNPVKGEREFQLSKISESDFLKYRQVDSYHGLLTEYIAGLKYPVTVIRGLRNTDDMAFEMNQSFWLHHLDNNIKIVNIFCDPEFDNVSSSALKTLMKYGSKEYEDFIVK